MKKMLSILIALLLVFSALNVLAEETAYPQLTGEEGLYKAGVYEQKIRGMGGWMIIHITFSADAIDDIEVVSHTETPNIGTLAIERVIPAMLEEQSAEVEGVTGATITSYALKDALAAALKEAAAAPADEKALYVPGVYEVKLRGMGGYMTIEVTFSASRIENFEVISHPGHPCHAGGPERGCGRCHRRYHHQQRPEGRDEGSDPEGFNSRGGEVHARYL